MGLFFVRKILLFLLVLMMPVARPEKAFALYFDGGDGDGYSSSLLGYTRSWGFTGGSGRGDEQLSGGTQTLVTFTSSSDQTFLVGDLSTAAGIMTIRQDLAVGTGIVTGNTIRITIPGGLRMTWDPLTPITIAGGHLSNLPAYTGGNKTMELSVTADFADGDTVTVSGVQFNNFTVASLGNLQLDITAGAGAFEIDAYQKTISVGERLTGFLGGAGRGEIELDIFQHPRDAIGFGTHF